MKFPTLLLAALSSTAGAQLQIAPTTRLQNDRLELAVAGLSSNAICDVYFARELNANPDWALYFRGNPGQTNFSLPVPEDDNGFFRLHSRIPTTNQALVLIQTPTNGATLSAPTIIVATLTNAFDLTFYRVDLAPADQVDLNNLGAPNAAFVTLTNVTLSPGVRSLSNAALATLDSTVLLNNSYIIRVYAEDTSGNGWYKSAVVSVLGEFKIGELRLEFADLTVPLAGVPISINRVYDTRTSSRRGDFGYGWSLGVRDAQIRETLRNGLHNGTLFDGSRVYLNAPDGRRVGFTAYPEIVGTFGFVFVNVRFRPDPGVYEKLEINGDPAAILFQGDFLGGLATENFDPSAYRLTMKDGSVFEYDQNAGLQRVTDLNGNRLVYTSQGVSHYLAGSTNADQQIAFVRDAQGRISEIIDPAGKRLTYTYDARGDLRSFTDQVTNVTQYFYATARAHYLTNIVDPLGHSALRPEYDSSGRLLGIRDANGHLARQEFPETNTVRFIEANGNARLVRYDNNGNEVMRAVEGVSTNYFAFDANNNEIWRKDARGFVTTRAYDNRGNPTNIVDALTNITSITYNGLSKPTSVKDPLGRTTQFRYNERGELTNVVNALGGQASFFRDPQGRVTSVTDFNGHTTVYDYQGGCSCGKPARVINPDGTFRTYEYDSLGQTVRETDELGRSMFLFYDDAGRLLWMRDAASNTTRYAYAGELKISETDPLGRTTYYAYDAANHQIAITNAMGGVVRFEYDHGTNRTAVIDAVGNVTRFYYDPANRLIQQVDPWGRTNTFVYDAAGNRIEVIDRNGRRRTFAYDALNRRTHEFWWEGATLVRTFVFTFNALGVMASASDPASHLAFDSDALYRLLKVTQSGIAGLPDFTLNYNYDGLTNVLSVTDNWGVQVASEYDIRDRLTKRVWQGGGLPGAQLQFGYDNAGNRTNVLRYADAAGSQLVGRSRYGYDAVGAITDILHANGAGAGLAEYHYQRDPAQQIVQRTIGNQVSAFAYDQAGQLTNGAYTPPTQPAESYRYDANGNRIGGGYVVTTNNQITADGTFTYGYDAEGSLVTRTNIADGATTAYTYDHRNRLLRVVSGDAGGAVTQTIQFTYDALNHRIARNVNGVVQHFLLNQENIWADIDAAGNVVARYLLGGRIDEMLARFWPTRGVEWYLTDSLGTVREIGDSAGLVVNHISYDSFGRILGQSAPLTTDRFLFTGREWDAETGLYYYRARYHDPFVGRFLSQDPVGFSSNDFNLYRYAGNSPLSAADPTGNASLFEYSIQIGQRVFLFAVHPAHHSWTILGIKVFCIHIQLLTYLQGVSGSGARVQIPLPWCSSLPF